MSGETGTPAVAEMTMSSRSFAEAMSPTPRTIAHEPFASRTLPPTFRLLSRTAATTALIGTPKARRRFGSTSI